MGKEQTVMGAGVGYITDPHGVPTGSVPRSPWGPLMHEEPTKEQLAREKHGRDWGPLMHEEPTKEQMARGRESGPGKWDQPCANTKQIGGNHYATQKIQPWDALEVWLTPDQIAGHFIASAVQYLARYNAAAPGKGGMEDVKKAHHYLSKLIELQS